MLLAENQEDAAQDLALDKILRAAEVEFAEKGFDGAGMKALAERAGVSQSLLHYHFGSKDKLYQAVIRQRSKLINDARLLRLRVIDLTEPSALDRIIEALFIPALGPEGGGKAYARIFAGLIAGHARDQALVRECYDPTAKEFLDAVEGALPGANRAIAAQIYQFALGVLASVISRDGRVERLMGNEADKLNDDALIRQLTRFVVGGAKAIADTT
ncbi:MAG: TetR/AcrR family transcriptional regulator [Pseudomonadota bacterium]